MDKETNISDVIATIPDGAVIMVGGFGSPGTPFSLIRELIKQGQKDLTLIKNDANETGIGISQLIENGQVRKLVASHIGLNKKVIDMMNTGSLEVALHPQGILAEKIRTAGAGSYAFLTDVGLHSEITKEEQVINWDGQRFKVENSLMADFALIHANKSDRLGNLVYRATAMNFCPLMAMAADNVIAEVCEIVETGELEPDKIHTPSVFVRDIVSIDDTDPLYSAIEGRYEYQ